jgi:SNF2 family DNA or RNA helicase
MLVVHGSWVPSRDAHPAGFVLWGEVSRDRRTPARRSKAGSAADRIRRHPFAATTEQLRAALGALGEPAGAPEGEPSTVLARLPSRDGAPLPSPGLVHGTETGAAPPALAPWRVPALMAGADSTPARLIALVDDPPRPDLALGDDLRFWVAAARLALALVCRQRLRPTLELDGTVYLARWRPLLDADGDAERVGRLAGAMPPAGRALAWDAAAPEPRPRELLQCFLEAVVDALAREAGPSLVAAPGRRAGRATRPVPPAEAWLRALFGDPVVAGEPDELAAFHRAYLAWAAPADDPSAGGDGFRVCFRLTPPPSAPDERGVVVPPAGAREWALEYLLQAADDPSLLVPSAEVWRQRSAAVRFLDRRVDRPQERLLAGLGTAARLFPPIEASLRTARPQACALTVAEAHELVRETALVLQAEGFGVLVPGLTTKLGVHVRLGSPAAEPGKASRPASFSWDTLVQYDWRIALDGEPLSREDFETLARLKEPLVRVRGQWVELRPDQIEQALAAFRRQGSDGGMPLTDALKLALAPNGQLGLPITEVTTEGWMDDLVRQLREGRRGEDVEEPPGFVGRLRPYQKVGVRWLATLRRFGLGACLADDMGLGKTIQLIALLLHRPRDEGSRPPGPTLLVCPTSVVGNWRRELARFAPDLRVLVHHGADRRSDELAAAAGRHDLVVSTYALLHRDLAALSGVEWAGVVLDEAQNIKNASTSTAQAARRVPARWRAALTGTPVENRLSELWSLFQFLNPGYLGPAEDFRKRFAGPIERAGDAAAAARLKALVTPFILRRLKTDRSIIADLPEKNEMKVFCTLTREQATLYQAVLGDALRRIDETEGIRRRGEVLGTLTRLKQVCDHPALFLHDRSPPGDRSGKLARLVEMLDEVTTVGDRALVFTQYAEMGRMLQEHLETAFGREVLFLHGGTPIAERDRMVARFQGDERGPQLFVLSLKAGGTGLNLTRANHVFHFDRWWNPAVENQASDRAFRIGQRRDVGVHKFVCAGTFEEALDGLIERKVALSEAIVGAGEAWITELSTEELRALFALRGDVVAAE